MTQSTVEERFDKKFPDGYCHFCGCGEGDLDGRWENYAKKQLLDFIKSELQLAEQKAREDMLEKYNKYLFEKCFVDDDIFNESPIEEFLSTL